jgi:aminoglycoside phosphotransferase family enzyme/predicted kinase
MNTLVASLLRPEAYDHPVAEIQLQETHISWVFLTGTYAYKLKKPVDYGFVNFSTPERRQHFCQEEVRLNRRLASNIYIDVVAVHGPPERANCWGDGLVIDHLVRMHQFPQQSMLGAVLARGELRDEQIDQLADDLARFQAAAAIAPAGGPYGSAKAVRDPVQANFATLEASKLLASDPRAAAGLERLRQWACEEWPRLEPRFQQRLASGRVREGHGDLHLGNMVVLDDRITVFDCLEFSDTLRWIDVISDMAFLVMDLQEHGQARLAMRLLNRWLEQTGDWEAMELWRWYGCYRALVRAKVAALGGSAALHSYLRFAEQLINPRPGVLAITTGVSGLGKSRHSLAVAERLGWIRLRSDVERKRMFGLWGIPNRAELSGNPYTLAVSEELFGKRLPGLAEQLIRAGHAVVVDATFLRRLDRQRMADLARQLNVIFLILQPIAPIEVARARIRNRLRHGRDASDASEAVLLEQLVLFEPLDAEENSCCIEVKANSDPDQLAMAVTKWCERQRQEPPR